MLGSSHLINNCRADELWCFSPFSLVIIEWKGTKDAFSSMSSFYVVKQVKIQILYDLPKVIQLVRVCAGARHMPFCVFILY